MQSQCWQSLASNASKVPARAALPRASSACRVAQRPGWLLAREESRRVDGQPGSYVWHSKWETSQQLAMNGSNSITTTGKAVTHRKGDPLSRAASHRALSRHSVNWCQIKYQEG